MPLKVLFAFPEPLPLPKARGLQVAWMVDALCDAGAELFLAYVPSDDNEHPLAPIGPDRPQKKELQLWPLHRNWPFPFNRWHSGACFAHRLKHRIEKDPPNVIFVRHLKLAVKLLRHFPHIPLVYEAHEVFARTARPTKQAYLARLEAEVMKGASGLVFISDAVRKSMHKAYAFANHEIVLHSGVTLPDQLPAKDWENSHRHIIYAGSFYDWKGVDDLIAAAAFLPGYRITLLGGETADLQRLRPKFPQDGAELVLLPRLPASQVMEHLGAACIAVLPNRSDGVSHFTSPLKLFEYMGAGCAVVAADLPSIREVLKSSGVGWFPPGNAEGLAAAIKQLCENPNAARDLGAQLRQASSAYTWSARGTRLLMFMKQLHPAPQDNDK